MTNATRLATLSETYTLASGVAIPKLGLGTWLIDNAEAAQAVRDAIALGYRHIDTAQAYGNEEGVGEGVRTCGVPREELFVTTKVAAEHKSYAAASASIDESLKTTGLDYFDLVIIHSPQPWDTFRATDKRYFEENKRVWKALEDAYAAGKVRAIGVSNFLQDDLESLLPSCNVRPMVNQVLAHAANMPESLIAFCQREGILVEAYSPIAHGAALHVDVIARIAARYNVTPAQLCIAYVLQKGLVALPKTTSSAHMAENAAVDFTISESDIAALDALSPLESYGEHSFFPVFSTQLEG